MTIGNRASRKKTECSTPHQTVKQPEKPKYPVKTIKRLRKYLQRNLIIECEKVRKTNSNVLSFYVRMILQCCFPNLFYTNVTPQ